MSPMIDLPEAGRRVLVRNVQVCHVPDENPDLSHLGKWVAKDEPGAIDRTKHGHDIDWNTCGYWMPGPNHYPHNPSNWAHVTSTELSRAFVKLPRQWRDRLGEFPGKPALLDAYYVEQDYRRMEAYERGDWQMIGIKARCELLIPYGNGSHIIQQIGTPGLWDVESDSDPSCGNQVADEELNTLLHMLRHLGVPARAAKAAIKEATRP